MPELQHYKICVFPLIFVFVSLPKVMPALRLFFFFFTLGVVILIDVSRNSLRVNFLITKVISVCPGGV